MEKCPHGLSSPRFIGVNEPERIQMRVHGVNDSPTLIYLPGLHGDWTLVSSFIPASAHNEVRCRLRPAASSLALACLLDKVREQFADQVLGLLVGQVALIVEVFRRIDHHFRLVAQGRKCGSRRYRMTASRTSF